MGTDEKPSGTMTLENAIHWIRMHGGEIGKLAQQKEPLALKVMATYMVCRESEFRHDRQFYAKAVGNLLGYLNEYIARDLNLDERAILRNKYGHHAEYDLKHLIDQPGIKL